MAVSKKSGKTAEKEKTQMHFQATMTGLSLQDEGEYCSYSFVFKGTHEGLDIRVETDPYDFCDDGGAVLQMLRDWIGEEACRFLLEQDGSINSRYMSLLIGRQASITLERVELPYTTEVSRFVHGSKKRWSVSHVGPEDGYGYIDDGDCVGY